MKIFSRRARRRPRVEIIPMVDVMVLLLVFYILSSVALSRQASIPVHLPAASTGQPAAVEPLVVAIEASGRVFLDREEVAPDLLGAALTRRAARLPGGMEALRQGELLVQADRAATHGSVVACLDQLRGLGIERFALAIDGRPAR